MALATDPALMIISHSAFGAFAGLAPRASARRVTPALYTNPRFMKHESIPLATQSATPLQNARGFICDALGDSLFCVRSRPAREQTTTLDSMAKTPHQSNTL